MAGTVSPEGKVLCICTIGLAQAARHYFSVVRVAGSLVVNVRPHGRFRGANPTSSGVTAFMTTLVCMVQANIEGGSSTLLGHGACSSEVGSNDRAARKRGRASHESKVA